MTEQVEQNLTNETKKSKYACTVCGYVYDESVERVLWADLAENWTCPKCGVGKDLFESMQEEPVVSSQKPAGIMPKTADKITKDMTIGELVQNYPSVVEIMLAEGVHCVGCGAAHWETIEQGLKGHGKTDKEVEEVVRKLNEAIPEEHGSSDKIIITSKAAVKLKEILKSQNKENMGLRIQVMPGGCSGFQYGFDFEESAKENDEVIEVEDVKFFIDTQSIQMLRGAKVDYVDSLQGAGFKISNPNAKATCGCGQSFS
ncbi:iron-sulfur cluster insertion protein ErpA [Candidatus Woesearchaeota archaeon]|nr:iron-sulfur cluster insertion protein ErpA [Candidatus Woesearchaeota archaeon]